MHTLTRLHNFCHSNFSQARSHFVISIFADAFVLCSLYDCSSVFMFQRCNPINYSELLVFIYLHRYILIAIIHTHCYLKCFKRSIYLVMVSPFAIAVAAISMLVWTKSSSRNAKHLYCSHLTCVLVLLSRRCCCRSPSFFVHSLLCTFTLIMFLRCER